MKQIALAFTFAALTACHQHSESKFLGKWRKISGPGATTIEIVPNGDHYLLIENGTSKTGLSKRDGMLTIAGTFPITYIEDSGHITVAGMGGVGEYIRAAANTPDEGQLNRVQADLQGISTQLKLYESMNGFTPSTEQGLRALATRPTSSPLPSRWYQLYKDLPKDPWGSDYCYELSGSEFRIFSAGPDKKPHTADDIGPQ